MWYLKPSFNRILNKFQFFIFDIYWFNFKPLNTIRFFLIFQNIANSNTPFFLRKSPILLIKKTSKSDCLKKKKNLSQQLLSTLIYLNTNLPSSQLFNKIQYFFFWTQNLLPYFTNFKKKIFGEAYIYLRGLCVIFFLDSLITDDEPLWEPIEWSLLQTWILFIFIFAWIAENLITSRFGSYTGRDKRVWFAWYKTFWLIELWYILSFGGAAMFVIVPFYYELTYSVSFVFSWWNWYNRIFFFKFIGTYSIIILISYVLQLNIRSSNWKKNFIFICLIFFFLSYLLYSQFIITFFSYFTDTLWYQKTRSIDYIQLSHEPLKWGWGPAKRDHFTYHKVNTVFWFKNDGPFAAAFLLINVFFFFSIFLLNIYWITLLRKTYATKELSFTFTTYCISSLKQFFFFFLLFYIFIFISFIVCYWRFPIEFVWIINSKSWIKCFFDVSINYLSFLIKLFI